MAPIRLASAAEFENREKAAGERNSAHCASFPRVALSWRGDAKVAQFMQFRATYNRFSRRS